MPETSDVEHAVPVVPLKDAPGERAAWGRPRAVVYAWGLAEWLLVTNPLQVSSRVRVAALRLFGASIGEGVIIRPRVRVKFPWNLSIGDHCWIGEGVWFHNQDRVSVGHDAVVSQETMVTTGSHALRRDMALLTSPVEIGAGAWVTSRCMVLGGSRIGRSAVVTPLSVVSGTVGAGEVWGGNPAVRRGTRFKEEQ